MKRALITGITGQDGSYLAEFLLRQGYHVSGIVRRASSFNTDRLDHLYVDPHSGDPRLKLYHGDLTDGTGLRRVLELGGLIASTVGFRGDILTDPSKPDGTPRKLLDISRILSTGWSPSIPFEEGLAAAYQDFLTQLSSGTARL